MSFVESPQQSAPEPLASCFASAALPAPEQQRLQLLREGDRRRAAVEDFIARTYHRHFAATIKEFMPVLASRCIGGTVVAAAGYRSAAEPLFLERYLPRAVESMLADATGQAIARDDIIEVGQFASRCAGEGRRLMPALARHLLDQGFRWAVITATSELRRLFERQQLAVVPLASAARHRVGDDAPLWGSYYRHAPKVVAGDLCLNLARLERGRG